MQPQSSESPQATIFVAVVEDDEATREGLARLIDDTEGFSCLRAFRSAEDALERNVSPAPDVFLLDIGLPGMSGCEGVLRLRAQYPSSQIVMLTVYAQEDRIFEAICNGACGYLLKEAAPPTLLDAIREAHAGGAPMSREIARKVVTLFQRHTARPKLEVRLSPQELRLVELLAEGFSYQGVANRMNVSVNTIRNYVRSVYDKLHVHTKSEAVSKVIRSRGI